MLDEAGAVKVALRLGKRREIQRLRDAVSYLRDARAVVSSGTAWKRSSTSP